MNAPQAQFSTQEQLNELRTLWNQLPCKFTRPANLIRLANENGLYDAADSVERKLDDLTTRNIFNYSPVWTEAEMLQLMEW